MNKRIIITILCISSTFFMIAQAPVNDLCDNAITINCGDIVTGDTTQATEADEPAVCDTTNSGSAGGVWYTFAGSGDVITLSLCGDPSFDTQIAVYSGNCSNLICENGNDQFCGNQSQVSFTSDPSTTYYVYIFGWIDGVGTYELEVTCIPPPPPTTNDLCEDAIAISCNETITGTTVGSTNNGAPTDFCGTSAGAPGNWYVFQGTGDIVTASLCTGTNFDSKIQIYNGNCFNLSCIDGSDNDCNLQSEVTFITDPSTNYYIYVFGVVGNTGIYTLNLTCSPPPLPPVNDECDQATVALVNSDESCTLLNPATIEGATASQQLNICNGDANDDIWFEFTATNQIHILELLNITGGTTNLVHAVYEGADCDNLTQISCNNPNESVLQNLTIGETYYLRIWSFGNNPLNSTTFDVCISSFFPPPPPVNDECDGAIFVDVNNDQTCTLITPGILTSATNSQVPSSCSVGDDNDVWFEFIATNESHQISLLNLDNTLDLAIAVYTGADCDNLTEISCSLSEFVSSSSFIIGETYYIKVFDLISAPLDEVTFDVCVSSFDSIIVNSINDPETSLSAEELIEQVFVDQGGCGTVDITVTEIKENAGGTSNIIQRSWGYFRQGNTNFPIEEGIILSTGFAVNAEGPNTQFGENSDSGFPWPGDADIQAILDNQYGTTEDTNNATSIEFEFVSNLPSVTFEFIFASEEYENQFECFDNFRDGFAFLVKGPGIPDTSGAPFGGVNIASIEGSDNVPVSTATIHLDPADDPVNGFLCGDEVPGVNYFPELYVSNFNDNFNDIPFSFDGLSASLTTAEVAIIPGEVYTIKMVIADRGDTAFDSAVFLKGGSFNLGDIDLGEDITIASGDAVCEGEVIELNVGDFQDGVYEWRQDGVLIEDATTGILEVTEAGTYTVLITFPNTTCVLTDDIFVEFFTTPEVDLGPDQLLCIGNNLLIDGTPANIADLTNVAYQWQLDGVDLAGETNPIITISSAGTYTINVTSSGNCVGTDEIIVTAVNFSVSLGADQEFCGENSFEIIPTIDGTDASNASYVWSTGATTPTLIVTESGTYGVDVTIEGCTETASVTVLLKTQPEIVINADEEIFLKCTFAEETLITTLTNAEEANVTYQWFFDGGILDGETNANITIEQDGTYTVEVNNDGCIATDDIEVQFYENTNCVVTQGISPNGDGLNDNVDLAYLEGEGGVKNFSIFNRYGALVYEKTNYINEWSGQDMDNNELPVGTYYYVIELNNPQDPLTGFIYINR